MHKIRGNIIGRAVAFATFLTSVALVSANSDGEGLLSVNELVAGNRGGNQLSANNASIGESEAVGVLDDLFGGADLFARQNRRCPPGQSFVRALPKFAMMQS